MKSLVTGAAGFIGSHVVDSLIELGHSVIALDDLSGGFRANLHPEAGFLQGSASDAALVKSIFETYRFDYVFHIAAYAAEGLSHFIRNFNYTNNLLGSVNLINAAVNHDVKCFVFTSSIAVYGSAQTPMTEETVPQPEDPYGISKYAVELDLRAANHMFGLDYIVFRPHNVYGERQNVGDPYRNVIGIFMNRTLQNRPLSIFGNGFQTRAFTHIADIAPVIAKSVHMPEMYNETYNIGADREYSVNELAREVQAAMHINTGIVHLPARNEVLHAFSNHNKLRDVFPMKAHTSLEEGLRRTAEWVKKYGAKKGHPFANIEVTKNLPESWRGLC